MSRSPTVVLVCALAVPFASAQAADLDAPYPYEPQARRPAVVDQRVVVAPSGLDEGLIPVRPLPPVGGPYLYAPGLNGPYGPPVYPLLPFAFGYGY